MKKWWLVLACFILQPMCANARTEKASMCEFRYVTMNTSESDIYYFVGKETFSEDELKRIVFILDKYKEAYSIQGNKVMVSCSLYGDFDYLHNLTQKAARLPRL